MTWETITRNFTCVNIYERFTTHLSPYLPVGMVNPALSLPVYTFSDSGKSACFTPYSDPVANSLAGQRPSFSANPRQLAPAFAVVDGRRQPVSNI
jgi:hypothetical protein